MDRPAAAIGGLSAEDKGMAAKKDTSVGILEEKEKKEWENDETVVSIVSEYHCKYSKSSYAFCNESGCMRKVQKKGFCVTHAKMHGIEIIYRKCRVDGCSKAPFKLSYCLEHVRKNGLKITRSRRPCKEASCEKKAARDGYCLFHAKDHNIINKPGDSGVCKEPECVKFVVKKGYCQMHAKAHGIEIRARTCKEGECTNVPHRRGVLLRTC